MADIACVFHWSLSEMSAMAVSELMAWRARAAARATPPAEGARHGPRPAYSRAV
ncbi:GpE family phage tail protein [Pedomonas mirosovicensis]|uniref:GpE family phage tail protein n=1 Tax=Pedomonas mirosovicensis TaxID=2908641 RepID=UPI002168F487|nr:GpE family phage tail protein [Pedomonas mirosovicensis]MCH8686453.1 GpE family phage tail protein [Pedomonas mirosovicensis]